MSDGSQSDLPLENEGPYSLTRAEPVGCPVARVVINGDSGDSELYGIQFYGTDGTCLLSVGEVDIGLARKEIKL
jgi:hypothetical protein